MLKINYLKKTVCPIKPLLINRAVNILARNVKKAKGEADIAVINDQKMKKLNRDYRGKNKTTDVLSFAFSEDKKVKSEYLGQIFISYPQIKRQAKQYGINEKEEFVRMLTHGMLHLSGYDHNSTVKEKKMLVLQEKIVKKIFSGGNSPARP